MNTNKVLAVCGLCLSALVGLSEIGYYFAHPDRVGVSPHLIGLSVAVALVAIASLITREK
jgi:hypothetical protein